MASTRAACLVPGTRGYQGTLRRNPCVPVGNYPMVMRQSKTRMGGIGLGLGMVAGLDGEGPVAHTCGFEPP